MTSPSSAPLEFSDPLTPEKSWYAVHEFTFPFGVGKYLGRVQAADRHEAERTAVERYKRKARELHLSPAGGRRRRRERRQGRSSR